MKEARSTRNKYKKKNELNPNPKESPKRAATKDDRNEFSHPSSNRNKNEDKLDISSESSDDEGSSSKGVGNLFGFAPKNNLNKNSKGINQSDNKTQTMGQLSARIKEDGRTSERKDDKIKKSLFKNQKENKIKASNSIGFVGARSMYDNKIRDIMNVQDGEKDQTWNVTQEWQNDKDLGQYQQKDQVGRLNKKNKNSRVGSREGSKKSKRHKKMISSIQSKHTRINNKSRQGNRRMIRNPKNLVVFNEFKTEDVVNREIGINIEEEKKGQFDSVEENEDYEIHMDESRLNEAVSDNYTLGDRSWSFSIEDESFMKELEEKGDDDFVEIIDQDSFDKLEAYRDRCPFLRIRKWMMKLRLMLTKSSYIIISNPLFEYVSLMVIVANSIVLAFEDPKNPEKNNTGPLATLDTVFLILYTIEMFMKILGYGFVLNEGSYLRDSWNILDFIIVVSAYLQLLISSGANLSVLRSFRVLRPLRTISGIEGLRVIVSALMKAVTLLVDTVIILVFFFIIFAIAGTQLWSGVLKKRCVNEYTGAIHPNDEFCGSVACPPGYFWGKTNENPNHGVTTFDNVLYSLLLVFQSVTLEGWSVIMGYVQKWFNFLSLFFFIPLVFIGAFFLLNLTLVVIKSKFTDEHHQNKERKKHRNHILKKMSKEDIKKLKNARIAYKKMKAINKKVKILHQDEKQEDQIQKVYDRILKDNNKKHEKKAEDVMYQSNAITDDPQSRVQTAKETSRGKPRVNILGMQPFMKNKAKGSDQINAELNEILEPDTSVPKERNVLYLKQGRGKLRMEGMYGISRIHENNGKNDLESQSDLLQDIPISVGEDGNTDDHEKESNSELKDSEIMFPLDSSLTDSTKNAKK